MSENFFDIIIIGGGFRALVTAYLALKKNKKVLIISKSKKLHGIMSPLKWHGGNFDKGYQFFDGIDEKQKFFLFDFIGKNILHDFGFGAATLTNNKILPYHALPHWPHEGNFFSLKLFFKHLLNYKKDIEVIINKAESYGDLIKLLPKEIQRILIDECERRIGIKANKLSFNLQSSSPRFCFRQSILPIFISTFLKKNSKYFNHTLASTRKSLGLDCISLYPKGKNMGVAADIMQKKITEYGAKIIASDELKIYKHGDNLVKVVTKEENFNTSKIFVVTELDDAINFFEKKISEKPSVYYLPQIFYYFTIDKINSKFQYVHGNNIGSLINRANNMSLYGEKTEDNECVISAEVCDNKNEDLWKNPEKYLNKVWNEVQLMGLANKNQKFTKYDIFPIKKTTSLELIGFNKVLKDLKSYTSKNFSNMIVFPGLGIPFSRGVFLREVEKEINFYE